MENFFVFKNKEYRENFFRDIKKFSNLKWREIHKNLNISKTSLEKYRSGKLRIKEENFYKLLNYFQDNYREEYLKCVKVVKPISWLRKGGRIAYKINFKKFEEGRKKGIESIKKRKRKKEEIQVNFALSKELCEVIGAFIGDGFFNFYRNKLYHIEFSGDKKKDYDYYLENIIPKIRLIFPEIKVHIKKIKRANTLRVIFYSKKFFYLLNKGFGFVPGRKAYTIFIPEKIMNSNQEFVNSTIRGIFDTDGCIFLDKRDIYNKPYPRITLQTVSEPLFKQLKDYLSKGFKIYIGKNKNRSTYYIEVYGHSQLKKWMSEIGFSNKRHLNRLPQ